MLHAWHDVSPGNELPRDFQAVIEIPLGSNVKYELDKPTGLLKVDRIIHVFTTHSQPTMEIVQNRKIIFKNPSDAPDVRD